jgi:hypothetical protein
MLLSSMRCTQPVSFTKRLSCISFKLIVSQTGLLHGVIHIGVFSRQLFSVKAYSKNTCEFLTLYLPFSPSISASRVIVGVVWKFIDFSSNGIVCSLSCSSLPYFAFQMWMLFCLHVLVHNLPFLQIVGQIVKMRLHEQVQLFQQLLMADCNTLQDSQKRQMKYHTRFVWCLIPSFC